MFLALPKQVVDAEAGIEEMTRRDAGRIGVVILCARSGYVHAGGAVIRIVALPGCEGVAWSRYTIAATETDCQLFGAGQSKNAVEIGDIACNQAAVVTPGKVGPWSGLLPLISEIRSLLEHLIMVDPEHRAVDRE